MESESSKLLEFYLHSKEIEKFEELKIKHLAHNPIGEEIYLMYLDVKLTEALDSKVFEIFYVAVNDALNNGYYVDICKFYMESQKLFVLNDSLGFDEAKKICENLLVDYSGDYMNNASIFDIYRTFIKESGQKFSEDILSRQIRSLYQRQLKIKSGDLDSVWNDYAAWEKKENLITNFRKIYMENKSTEEVYKNFDKELLEIEDQMESENVQNSSELYERSVVLQNALLKDENLSVTFRIYNFEKLCMIFFKKREVWENYIQFLKTQFGNNRLASVYRRASRYQNSFELSLKVI